MSGRAQCGTFRRDFSDVEIYLPGELAELASYNSDELPQTAYAEVMEAADMLHHLGITSSAQLGAALGASYDSNHKQWKFDPTPALAPFRGVETPSETNVDFSDDEYAELVYEGRKLCDAEELGSAYMGSVSRDVHDSQVQDPASWVHKSRCTWLERAMKELFHGAPPPLPPYKEEKPPTLSDRRLAVNATKRKNDDE